MKKAITVIYLIWCIIAIAYWISNRDRASAGLFNTGCVWFGANLIAGILLHINTYTDDI